MPRRAWVMTQTWNDLLFAHWPVSAALLQRLVPREFPIDIHEGKAWLGVVPFHMTNVSLRGVPALPWISAFPELNVRTYVTVAGKPGVYFFSLDAANPLAVRTARLLLNLPYFTAVMNVTAHAGGVEYRSRRKSGADAELQVSYRPIGSVFNPEPGTLEYFLTERYCLYNRFRSGATYRLDIHHPPWSLQPATAEFRRSTMGDAAGIVLPDTPPLLHFSRRQDMVGWGAEPT